MTQQKTDKRVVRSKRALREALAIEIDLHGTDGLTVCALADRADLTRRTFYTHYRDIPSFIDCAEDEVLNEMVSILQRVKDTTLDELFVAMSEGRGYPGALEIFEFVKENATFMSAMLGPKGNPAFQVKMKEVIRVNLIDRLLDGIDTFALNSIFDYYVEYLISAILGVLQRWLETGCKQSPEEMATVITVILFLRPGDLYGKPLEDYLDSYPSTSQGVSR